MLKSCIHIGIYTAKEIMEAFEDLGYFYNMNEASLNLAKVSISRVQSNLFKSCCYCGQGKQGFSDFNWHVREVRAIKRLV